MYYVYPKIGNTITGPPTAMSPEEYKEYVLALQTRAYYKEKSEKYNLLFRKDKSDARKKGLIPSVMINNKLFETLFGEIKLRSSLPDMHPLTLQDFTRKSITR